MTAPTQTRGNSRRSAATSRGPEEGIQRLLEEQGFCAA
jgi:hypothetical protein